jgi:chromosome segregation ATPase
MTADNQALLSAIRQIVSESVSEAIVPLTKRIDALTERVDALTERVDALTERVDALTERSQRIEAEQRDQRVILSSLSTRLDSVVAYVMRLDSRVETIESRLGEMAADIFDMQERLRMVEDRVREGFHALKSDFQVAFSDIRAIRKTQNRHDTTIAALHDERAVIQQRLSALEGQQT